MREKNGSQAKRKPGKMNQTTTQWAQDQMLDRPQAHHYKARSNVMSSQNDRRPSLTTSVDRRQAKSGSLSGSVTATFKGQRNSISSKQITPMYVNVTGPGDYHVPGFADRIFGEPESYKRTAPSFTCAPKTKQPYFPGYEVVSTQIKNRNAFPPSFNVPLTHTLFLYRTLKVKIRQA